jgi:hypothetical protein
MTREQTRNAFLTAAYALAGGDPVITRPQVLEAAASGGVPNPAWLTNDPAYRAGRGQYRLPPMHQASRAAAPVVPVTAAAAPVTATASEEQPCGPEPVHAGD